jgi:hypothetical protein
VSDPMETTVIADGSEGRNPLVLVAAVAGALLAAVLIWFFVAAPLLAGGDDDVAAAPAAGATDDVAATAAASDTEAATDAAAEVAADEAALPIVTYEVFIDRDPFEPVVPEPASATADAGVDPVDGTDGSVTDGTTGGTTDGSTDGTGDGTTDAPDGCTSGDQVVCDGRVVSLVDIRTDDDGARVAIVQVDTTLYEVEPGQIFAGAFQVQSISGDRVFLLYGDDAFELQKGDRVLK